MNVNVMFPVSPGRHYEFSLASETIFLTSELPFLMPHFKSNFVKFKNKIKNKKVKKDYPCQQLQLKKNKKSEEF